MRIIQTLLIALLFYVVFGIIGVEFFKGLLYYCESNSTSSGTVDSSYDCMNYGGEWRDRDISFDNIFLATMTLFELSTGKSLTNLFNYLPDIAGLEKAPIENNRPFYIIYVMIYMLFGFFFIRAFLTGVISDTFSKEKDKLQGFSMLSPIQVKWAQLAKIIFKAHPIKKYPETSKTYPLHRMFTSTGYEAFMIVMLLWSTISLALTWFRAPESVNEVVDILIICQYLIYCLNLILKIICYRTSFFEGGWNWLEFIQVVGSLFCIILQLFVEINEGPQQALIHIFFTSRLLFFFLYAKVLRKMFQTIILALPAIVNLALLFIIFLLPARSIWSESLC
eukprot:TRINITY_DN34577_c0_g1_i1.p1 TRINITY_DN34577_c0_g1~~TRINITY_DN34577_c0_g1_i1.p1  ORF type:complete len:370 (+),score=21.68 TRINITY_DN34577_c0_g1_i1:103-1110(+)